MGAGTRPGARRAGRSPKRASPGWCGRAGCPRSGSPARRHPAAAPAPARSRSAGRCRRRPRAGGTPTGRRWRRAGSSTPPPSRSAGDPACDAEGSGVALGRPGAAHRRGQRGAGLVEEAEPHAPRVSAALDPRPVLGSPPRDGVGRRYDQGEEICNTTPDPPTPAQRQRGDQLAAAAPLRPNEQRRPPHRTPSSPPGRGGSPSRTQPQVGAPTALARSNDQPAAEADRLLW
jgi:hypothetical protein